MTTNDARGLYCLDWAKEDMNLYGVSSADNFQRLEFNLLPCNYLHQQYGPSGDYIADECIADLK